MSEEKKEKWMSYLAISTVLFAVCATLSTFKGGGYSTKSLLSQSKASDQWAYFQSKSIKGYIYDIQRENLELDLEKSKNDLAGAEKYKERISQYKEKVEKYENEKVEIKQKAEKLESERDEARVHSQAFGMAVIFLQVSILLSSIAALTKRKPIWYISIFTGLVGIFYFINGFLLFI